MAKPDPSSELTKVGSTMSQGRTPTPRSGLDRFYADHQHIRIRAFVKQDSQNLARLELPLHKRMYHSI